jgi:hypothetical protein
VIAEEAAEPERTAATYGDGIPFMQWTLLWQVGGAVALVSLAFDILSNSAFGQSEWLRSSWPGTILGRDFTNLWVAGRLVLAQMPACVFDTGCFQSHNFRDLHIATVKNYS